MRLLFAKLKVEEIMTNDLGLEVRDVSHKYGKKFSVRAASLDVSAGSVHCLLGHSGSGKTTLLRIIAGLEYALGGKVMLGGQTVTCEGVHHPTEKRSIGFVFQNYALFPHLSVIRNVMFGMGRRSRKEQRELAMDLLRQVELEDYARSMPHTLSGGQQQRVALARALGRKPAVMLLDEPFSELDARLRSEVREITLRVLRASGTATLMVTHDPQEALSSGDKVSVMHLGRIEQTASPDQIYHRPANERTAQIFGVINRISSDSEFGKTLPRREETGEWLIRPEQIELSNASGVGERCRGVIVQICYEGPTVLVQSRLNSGQLIWSREFAPTNFRVGESVQVYLSVGDGFGQASAERWKTRA